MGVSTDGQICFGIPFEEDYIFPWDNEKYEGDFDEWYLYEICGYKNPFELYNDKGEYIDGKKPLKDKILEYHDTKSNFSKEYPSPIELVNYCSGDCPMYIIAIPRSFKSNSRGYPKVFDPKELTVTDEEKQNLIDFCEKYCKPTEDTCCEFPKVEPEWCLSSLWS